MTTPETINSDQREVGGDTRSLAAQIVPQLIDSCEGQLTDLTWFKADWQRGGAATATAQWTTTGTDEPRPAIVKFPIVERELRWTRRLSGRGNGVTPELLASGDSIGGYDFAWIVIEKFEHGPIGLHWHDDHIPRIASAVAEFYKAADDFDIDREPRYEDWHAQVEDSLKSLKDNAIDEEQVWRNLLKDLRGRLDDLVAEWRARPMAGWLHGDLHIANAMSRAGIDEGPVALIDLAEVHPGHWVEDAVYLERQCWARPERIKKHKPVKAIAKARRALGLEVDPDHPRLAMIRRTLLAATAPKYIKSEGHPAHMAACLKWLGIGLKELA